MQWADLDLEAGTWTLPRDATKADREHTVPLSEPVVAIIKAVPRAKDQEFIFTTTAGRTDDSGIPKTETAISGFSRAKQQADALVVEAAREVAEEAGDDPDDVNGIADWRMHDLRRTAASNMARMGFPPHVVAAVLNHSPGATQGVTAIYNRYRYGDEKRAALNAWANHVTAITEGRAENVVAFEAGADRRSQERTHSGDRPDSGSHAVQHADTSVGVSFMITRRQREMLQSLGYSDDEIRKMKPEEALKILGLHEKATADDAAG